MNFTSGTALAYWSVSIDTAALLAEQAIADTLDEGLVADLRLTASHYPADRTLRRLIDQLADSSPRFAELWDADAPPPLPDPSKRKVIDHPTVGRITLDCDTLIVAVDDLRIMVYTAEPGTQDAERLALAIALGTQSLLE